MSDPYKIEPYYIALLICLLFVLTILLVWLIVVNMRRLWTWHKRLGQVRPIHNNTQQKQPIITHSTPSKCGGNGSNNANINNNINSSNSRRSSGNGRSTTSAGREWSAKAVRGSAVCDVSAGVSGGGGGASQLDVNSNSNNSSNNTNSHSNNNNNNNKKVLLKPTEKDVLIVLDAYEA